jgi:fibronectin type 3 domain-containing protein
VTAAAAAVALAAVGGISAVTKAAPPLRIDFVPGATVEATDASGADAHYIVKSQDTNGDPAPATCTNPDTSDTGQFSSATLHYPLGPTTVTCTSDYDTASETITVVDTTPPTVGSVQDVSATTNDSDGTPVTYSAPSATDLVDDSVQVTCDPASGSKFPVGSTTVTCSATDAHNNTGTSSFQVNVSFADNQPPAFTSVPPDTSIEATGANGAPFSYTVTATDNVGTPSVSCSPASGSTFPIGSTTVNCTATDSAGLTANASFKVTVTFVDRTPPVFSNVPSDLQREANGPGGSVVTYTPPNATDALDGPIATVACAPASGSTFPLGTTTVSCSARDANGNAGTATFHVTVTDTTPPRLIVPGDRNVYATSGEGISAQEGGAAEFVAGASANDLVDPRPTITSDAPGAFLVGKTMVTFVARDASGNTAATTATLTVRPMPLAGTTPQPLPPPADRRPPDDVAGLKVTAGDRVVTLQWTNPGTADFAGVVISRSRSDDPTSTVVFRGRATKFADRSVVNGVEYRYIVVATDAAGNSSGGVAAVAQPKQLMLRSPRNGAAVKKPPKLLWLAVASADYYNVQLFQGSTKILSAWPKRSSFALHRSWRYAGTRHTLKPGVYTWYVWPGYGAVADVKYGGLLGSSSFVVR